MSRIKFRPEGCTELVRLKFLEPDPKLGNADYQSTLDVGIEAVPVYAHVEEMYDALKGVLYAVAGDDPQILDFHGEHDDLTLILTAQQARHIRDLLARIEQES